MKDVYYNSEKRLMTIHVTAGCTLFYNNYYYLHVPTTPRRSVLEGYHCCLQISNLFLCYYAFRDG